MHCGKMISVAISFLKNASLPGLLERLLEIDHKMIILGDINMDLLFNLVIIIGKKVIYQNRGRGNQYSMRHLERLLEIERESEELYAFNNDGLVTYIFIYFLGKVLQVCQMYVKGRQVSLVQNCRYELRYMYKCYKYMCYIFCFTNC